MIKDAKVNNFQNNTQNKSYNITNNCMHKERELQEKEYTGGTLKLNTVTYFDNKDEDLSDYSEIGKAKSYLDLAFADLMLVMAGTDKLATSALSITVLIAQVIEKCLSHLLMIKGVKFLPTHKCVSLLNQVLNEYPDFPKEINHVACTLCTVWYQTNRYPQSSSKGYENYHLILAMTRLADTLVKYCKAKTSETDIANLDFTKYKITEQLQQLDIIPSKKRY